MSDSNVEKTKAQALLGLRSVVKVRCHAEIDGDGMTRVIVTYYSFLLL